MSCTGGAWSLVRTRVRNENGEKMGGTFVDKEIGIRCRVGVRRRKLFGRRVGNFIAETGSAESLSGTA
jgi:hypothetical protein